MLSPLLMFVMGHTCLLAVHASTVVHAAEMLERTGGVKALKDITLNPESGECILYITESGCGG